MSLKTALVSGALLLATAFHGAHARDQFDRPSLEIPKAAGKLTVAFADSEKWDGKHIDRTMG